MKMATAELRMAREDVQNLIDLTNPENRKIQVSEALAKIAGLLLLQVDRLRENPDRDISLDGNYGLELRLNITLNTRTDHEGDLVPIR